MSKATNKQQALYDEVLLQFVEHAERPDSNSWDVFVSYLHVVAGTAVLLEVTLEELQTFVARSYTHAVEEYAETGGSDDSLQ